MAPQFLKPWLRQRLEGVGVGVGVDDEAFVTAPADLLGTVVADDAEHQSASVDLDQLDVDPDGETGRGQGNVGYVDVGADGLLLGPIQVGDERVDAGALDEPDEEGVADTCGMTATPRSR